MNTALPSKNICPSLYAECYEWSGYYTYSEGASILQKFKACNNGTEYLLYHDKPKLENAFSVDDDVIGEDTMFAVRCYGLTKKPPTNICLMGHSKGFILRKDIHELVMSHPNRDLPSVYPLKIFNGANKEWKDGHSYVFLNSNFPTLKKKTGTPSPRAQEDRNIKQVISRMNELRDIYILDKKNNKLTGEDTIYYRHCLSDICGLFFSEKMVLRLIELDPDLVFDPVLLSNHPVAGAPVMFPSTEGIYRYCREYLPAESPSYERFRFDVEDEFKQMKPSYFLHLLGQVENVEVKDQLGQTALMRAACFGDIDAMEQLIALGADVNAKSNRGETVAHYAASHGQLEALMLLHDQGADLNVADKYKSTPLQEAVRNNHTNVASYLAQMYPNSIQSDAEEFSQVAKRKEMWEFLLTHGISPNIQIKTVIKTDSNYNAIQWMMVPMALFFITNLKDDEYARKLDIFKSFLSHGTNANLHDDNNYTLLMRAVEVQNPDVVKMLLDYGADPHRTDKYGKTALNYTEEHSSNWSSILDPDFIKKHNTKIQSMLKKAMKRTSNS